MENQHRRNHCFDIFPAGYTLNLSWCYSIIQTQKIILFQLIGLICLFFSLSVPANVFAQITQNPSSGIIIAPTFQEVTLNPDQTSQTAQIEVFNQTNQRQIFEIYAVPVNQIDNQGNFTLSDKPLSNTEQPESAFLTFPNSELEILPNQVGTIPFSVINSQSLSPGGNYVVVIVRAKPNPTATLSNQSVLPAVSAFVLIRKLGGEQYNLSLSEISSDHQLWWQLPTSLRLTFENQGNIHTTPHGLIQITDLFGRVVVEGTINESSQFVFPRTKKEIAVQLKQIRPSWPFMLYNIKIDGQANPGTITYAQQSFSIFVSLTAILVVVGVAVILVVGYTKITKFKKQKHAETI